MDRPAIFTEGLQKRYGDIEALKGIDLSVPEGTVLGLLGPNGAGKTTAVRILTTLLPPDGGRAEVGGLDVVRDAEKLRAMIGLAGQFAAVDEPLTGRENLEMVARLYHLGRDTARKRADELLERFDLTEASDRLVKTYSGGMRRRLDLAASLVGRPNILFLDEPTTGLDPKGRMSLWDVIRGLVDEGTTLLLTTQYLEEADKLADRIAVIDGGLVIAQGTADDLKEKIGGQVIEVRLDDPSALDKALATLAGVNGAETTSDGDGKVTIPVTGRATQELAEVARRLESASIVVSDLAVRRPTLDDVFLTLTGHGAESEEPSSNGAGKRGRGRRGR